MTSHDKTAREPGPPRQADPPLIPDPRSPGKDIREMTDPCDLPFPDDRRLPGRPAYVIVVDQLRGWRPGQPPSLAELLETRPARPRDPGPDLEAEP